MSSDSGSHPLRGLLMIKQRPCMSKRGRSSLHQSSPTAFVPPEEAAVSDWSERSQRADQSLAAAHEGDIAEPVGSYTRATRRMSHGACVRGEHMPVTLLRPGGGRAPSRFADHKHPRACVNRDPSLRGLPHHGPHERAPSLSETVGMLHAVQRSGARPEPGPRLAAPVYLRSRTARATSD